MAHECHDREDLLRDARALVPRFQVRAQLSGKSTSVFAGFRGDALSIYFGADPVFHFNAAGELRRAHVDGRLVKADAGRLTAMERVSTATAVELRAEELSDDQQQVLLERLTTLLAELRGELDGGRHAVEGAVPDDSVGLSRFQAWLNDHPQPTTAQSPRVVEP